jgi:hypothetical protein
MAAAWLPGILAERERRRESEAVSDEAGRERKRVALAFAGLFARARTAAGKG